MAKTNKQRQKLYRERQKRYVANVRQSLELIKITAEDALLLQPKEIKK